jgi:ankyrin repeat protein
MIFLDRSPADNAWVSILFNLSTPFAIHTRTLLGTDDDYEFQFSPLHQIILGFSSVDAQEQLSLEPARIDEQDWMGMSPLMWAAYRGDHVIVPLLLSYRASVELQNWEGNTALHLAVVSGSLDCVTLLLDAGANPNISNNYGSIALHIMAYLELSQPLAEDIVSILRDHQGNIQARNHHGRTPLSAAVMNGNLPTTRALVRFGADIDTLDYEELPAIAVAIFHCNYEVIKVLCELGARWYWTTTLHSGNNVLKIVAYQGTVEAMNILAAYKSPPVDYDPDEIWDWFNKLRQNTTIYGQRFSEDEERAAFQNLLDKKGNKVVRIAEEDASSNEVESDQSTDVDESGYVCDEGSEQRIEDEESDQNSDDEEKAEDFEDALESFH